MNTTKLGWLIFASAAVVAAAFFFFRLKSGNQARLYVFEPVEFVYRPDGAPAAAAIIHGRSVSERELHERSRVLADLAFQECKMLAEAAAKLSSGSAAARLELFAVDLNGELKTALEGLKLPLNITLSETPLDGVARLDGKPLSRESLSLNQVQYSLLKTRQFNEKLAVLRDLLVNQLLFDSAKALNLPLEKFIEEKILKGVVQVSDEELAAFARQNGIPPGASANETRGRLGPLVLDRKRTAAIHDYIKQNFEEKGEIFFAPPSYVFPVNENKLLISSGNPGSATVLVFSNLECSACLQLASELLALKRKYRDQIRVGFANVFAPGDWRSQLTAEASYCMNAQKNEHFWSLLESATADAAPPDEAKINETVKKVGAEYEPFRTCLLKRQFKDEVTAQLKYAADFGVLTAPTVIVGSRVFAGPVRRAELEAAVAELLAR